MALDSLKRRGKDRSRRSIHQTVQSLSKLNIIFFFSGKKPSEKNGDA